MSSYKRDYDYYDNSNSNHSFDSQRSNKRKRKSRWGGDETEKVFIPGMPTIIPSNLSKNQEEIYLLQVQIESISRRLLTGDLGIPENPEERSPSPEPIYNTEGKRLNTREFRTRKKFEDERHALILKMYSLNPTYKPPADYKPPQTKISEKVLIPQEEYPDINFVGLIIGPRGNTLKGMERDTNAKIIIRGKGSVKEGKLARKDGQPLPGEDEPLHAFVTGPNQESVLKAVQKINEVIKKGIELPENMNDLRRSQLRELALLNGTLRENDGPRCSNCGANTHRSWQCPDKPNVTNNVFCTNCNGVGHIAKDCKERPSVDNVNTAKIDEEYLSLMAELGEAPPAPAPSSAKSTSNHTNPAPPSNPPNPIHPTAPSNSENGNNGTDASATWSGYGAYDPYNAYAQMWDPSAWAASAGATLPPPPGSAGDNTTGSSASIDYSGYDPTAWAQWSQWYAANVAAVAGVPPAGAVTTTAPPIPGSQQMYAPPPPPPPKP